MLRRIFTVGTSFLVALFASHVASQELDIQTIELPFRVVQAPISANLTAHPGKELVVIGVDEQGTRILAILVQGECCNDWRVLEQHTLARNWITFDIGKRENGEQEHLYFLNRKTIQRFVPEQTENSFVHVQDIESTYQLDDVDFIHRTEFVRDLNHDSIDDFILTGFTTLNVWLSKPDASLQANYLPVSSLASVYSGEEAGHVRYRQPNFEMVDTDQDGLDDIVHINDGHLRIFKTSADGSFELGPTVDTHDELSAFEWWLEDEEDGQQKSRSNLSHKRVIGLTDINGDKVPDLLVMHTSASNILSQNDNLEFYWGQFVEGKLRYKPEPSTTITYAETINNISVRDIDDDGREEVLISSLKLGVRKIVAALFSGHVGQDIYIFSLDKDNGFGDSPIVKEKVNLSFSLTEGTAGDPLYELADFNGDGIKDLIVSDGDDALNVLTGTNNGQLDMANRGVKYDFALPVNSSGVSTDDLNLDGKDDLIFHYGRLDDAQLRNTIAIVKGS